MKFENKFDSFKDLKKFSSNPEEVIVVDNNNISENLTTDDNKGNKEILESFKVEDGADLTPEQLEEELKEVLDKEENKIPYNPKHVHKNTVI